MAMEVFDGEMVVTAQGQQQPTQAPGDTPRTMNQFVPHQQAGMGAVAAQEQFDRQQVGECVHQSTPQIPMPLGAHLQQQPHICDKQPGDTPHHRCGQVF